MNIFIQAYIIGSVAMAGIVVGSLMQWDARNPSDKWPVAGLVLLPIISGLLWPVFLLAVMLSPRRIDID